MISPGILDYMRRKLSGRRGYAICTAPRTGSNLLCQYLTSTGVLGRPLEYFNGPGRRELTDPNYPDAPSAQIHQILTVGSTQNGVYGVKLFAYQNAAVMPVLDWTLALPNLSFVYLERRDRLGQALSWTRALQTARYRSTQVEKGTPIYDDLAIRERLDMLHFEHAQWLEFFESRNIKPLEFVYEDFILNAQDTVDRVAAFIGIRSSARIAHDSIDLDVQRDAMTEEWRARFLRDLTDPAIAAKHGS